MRDNIGESGDSCGYLHGSFEEGTEGGNHPRKVEGDGGLCAASGRNEGSDW